MTGFVVRGHTYESVLLASSQLLQNIWLKDFKNMYYFSYLLFLIIFILLLCFNLILVKALTKETKWGKIM